MRLDVYLVSMQLVPTRSKAVHLIKTGMVVVNEKIVLKQAYQVKDKDIIKLKETFAFVGWGGYKIADFIQDLHLTLENQTALDVGCSNGGFSDYLLQHNVKQVVAIDIAMVILDERLQKHPKISFYGGIDVKNQESLSSCLTGQKFQLITIDVSNVPLILILNNISPYLERDGTIIALLKHIYEKSGKTTDIYQIAESFENSLGTKFIIVAKKICPLRGGIKGKGVQEFFYQLKKASIFVDSI